MGSADKEPVIATTNSGSSRASLRQQQEADERAQRSRRIVIAGIGIAAPPSYFVGDQQLIVYDYEAQQVLVEPTSEAFLAAVQQLA